MRNIFLILLFLIMLSAKCFAITEISVSAKSYVELKKQIKRCIGERYESFEVTYTGNKSILNIIKSGNPTKDEYFSPKLIREIKESYSPLYYEYYQVKNLWDDIKIERQHIHIMIGVTYHMNREQSKIAEEKLLELEKELEPIIKNTNTDFQKVRILHDNVARQLTYYNNGTTCYSIYGALLESKGVCMSYGLLFQRLCDYFKVPCRIVIGDVMTSKRDAQHMWNMVKLNNKWYHVDITWDDTNDKKSYKYSLKSDIFMQSREAGIRKWRWKLYPECLENF